MSLDSKNLEASPPADQPAQTVESGDIGAIWLASYTGPRRLITDEDSKRVQRKVRPLPLRRRLVTAHCQIDLHLMPV